MAPSRLTPRIGITTYGRGVAGDYSLPADYVDALSRAGARVTMLPPTGAQHADAWLDDLDGLVLAGGGDIDPGQYDSPPHSTHYMIDASRDETEIALARAAIARGLPLLAICRGLQILNVACGGSLVPHLPDRSDALAHRVAPRRPTMHEIAVEPGTLLEDTLHVETVWCASWHHQAVDRVGTGLRVNATAPDGTIEGIESTDGSWTLAVQWHPELTAAHDKVQQALFDGLIGAAK